MKIHMRRKNSLGAAAALLLLMLYLQCHASAYSLGHISQNGHGKLCVYQEGKHSFTPMNQVLSVKGSYDQMGMILLPGLKSFWERILIIAQGMVNVLQFILIGILSFVIYRNRNYERRVMESEEHIRDQNQSLKKEKARYRELAFYDMLTGLYNRQMLQDKLNEKLVVGSSTSFALYYVDLDNFKFINDTMGHAFGDQVILRISDELKKLQKYSGVSIYKTGGDEFALLLEDYKELMIAQNYAKKILNCIKKTVDIEGRSFNLTASIGISLFPVDGETGMELLQNADTAMYRVKSGGKNGYGFYDREYHNEIVNAIRMNEELQTAVAQQEFILHYQPQWDINSQKISGIEALIRWIRPDGSYITPDKFIPIAEKTGLIIPIGEWVLKAACRFALELHQRGFKELQLSVNVSVKQLMQEHFVGMVTSVLRETGFEAQKLTLEITESVLMENFNENIHKLNRLRDMGIKVALDDFGKGYSSLSYLKRLPISVLKIDKTFVDDIREYNSSPFIDSIISVGHKMNMEIVAEGVETEKQMNYLSEFRCDKIQGFWISRPLREEALVSLLYEKKEIRS